MGEHLIPIRMEVPEGSRPPTGQHTRMKHVHLAPRIDTGEYVPVPTLVCGQCDQPWPCDAVRAIQAQVPDE